MLWSSWIGRLLDTQDIVGSIPAGAPFGNFLTHLFWQYQCTVSMCDATEKLFKFILIFSILAILEYYTWLRGNHGYGTLSFR